MKEEGTENYRAPKAPLGDGDKQYWNKWYAAVMIFLLLQILLYYFITVYFK
jgi:hypothetical protein